MLDAAKRLVDLGIPVHWLTAPVPGNDATGKSPAFREWQTTGFQNYERLAATYKPGYNIGIHCGYVEGAPHNFVGMDLDSQNAIIWARNHFPEPVIQTITSQGAHWLYKHPGKGILIRGTRIPGRENDHFRGDGGQVVCAPSIHFTGFQYQEATPFTLAGINSLPTFDLAWAPGPAVIHIQKPPSSNLNPQRTRAWAHQALEGGVKEVRAAAQFSRNNTLNAVAFRLGRFVGGSWLQLDEVQSALERAAHDIGLQSSEVPKTIRSGISSGMSQPHPGPSDVEQPKISNDAYIAAGILQHGYSSFAAAGGQPSDLSDPHAVTIATIAKDMPGENVTAEVPGYPADWDKIPTTVQELTSRTEKLVADRPPVIPDEYFCENPEIPRFPLHIDNSGWDSSIPIIPLVILETLKLRSNSHVAIAEEIAIRIARRTGRDPIYSEGKLWAYNDNVGIWEPYQAIESVTQSIDDIPYGTKASKGIDSPAGKLALRRSDIEGSIKCLEKNARQDDFFVQATPGIAFRNCFVQVTAQGLRILQNHPDNRARFAYDFDYSPADSCPTFGRVLGELFAPNRDSLERKAMLFEFIGASLIGIVTHYQKAVVFTGPPGCGKSVVFAVLKSIFPPGSVVAVLPEELHLQWEKVRLAGAKLNACDELNGITISAVGTLKAGITGNEIQGREVGEQGYSFVSLCGWLLSFNRPPRFNDISGGLEDRLNVIKFSRRFRDSPQDNKHLARDIIEAERSGIVALALEGAVRLISQGRYTIAPSSREALTEWSESNNPALLFSREKLERTTGLSAKWLDIFKAYQEWGAASGYKNLMTAHTLKGALITAGFQIHDKWITAKLV